MPKVTVLLTSYNYEAFIRESIQSVLSQTFKDFELIVVDDCSTDSSFEIITSFDDKRLKIIRNKKNMGQEFAFGLLHQNVKSEYVAIADADCRWAPDKLQKQVEFLDSRKEYAAVFTKANFIDGNGNKNTTKEASLFNDALNVKNRNRQEWLRHFFYYGNCFCNPSVLIRCEHFNDCYATTHGVWVLQDMYKWIRLLLKSDVFILDEKLVDVRLHGSNMSIPGDVNGFLRVSNELYQTYDLFYKMNKNDFFAVFNEEAKKYTVNGKINIKFALSKMMLATDYPAANALALNTLFSMLNNPTEKSELEELYGYGDISYRDDETENAPYIINPFMKTVNCYNTRLYFDFGKGFSEQDSLTRDVLCSWTGKFAVKYTDIEKFCDGKKLSSLRFDPDNNCVKINLESVIIDGKKVSFEVNKGIIANNQHSIDNGLDVFYTGDPSYIIYPSNEKIKSVEIIGEMFPLTANEIAVTLDKTKNDARNELESLRNDFAEKLNAKQREHDLTKSQLEVVQSQLNETSYQLQITLGSISWRITKPLRKAKEILKRISGKGKS